MFGTISIRDTLLKIESRCPQCDGIVSPTPIMRVPDDDRFDGFFRCTKCSLVSLLPYPDSDTVFSFYDTGWGNWRLHSDSEILIPNRRRRKKIERICGIGSGSLYEVGASRGGFLAEMIRNGWRVAGVEPGPRAVAYARETYGLKLDQAFFTPEICGDKEYDVLVGWDVLEHCREPAGVLKAMFSYVKNGGFIFLAVPYISGLPARLLKERWRYRCTPMHLHFFPLNWFATRTQLYGGTLVSVEGFSKIHAWIEAILPRNKVASFRRHMPVRDFPDTPFSRIKHSVRKSILRINHSTSPLPLADLIEIAIRVER